MMAPTGPTGPVGYGCDGIAYLVFNEDNVAGFWDPNAIGTGIDNAFGYTLPFEPVAVAVDPALERSYFMDTGGSIAIVSTREGLVNIVRPFVSSSSVVYAAVNPVNHQLILSYPDSNMIAKVNGYTGEPITEIDFQNPGPIAVDPFTNRILIAERVSDSGFSSITALDGTSLGSYNTFDLENSVITIADMAYDQCRDILFIASSDGSAVALQNTRSGQMESPAFVTVLDLSHSTAVAVDPVMQKAFFNEPNNSIISVDTCTLSPLDSTQRDPFANVVKLAVDERSHLLYALTDAHRIDIFGTDLHPMWSISNAARTQLIAVSVCRSYYCGYCYRIPPNFA